MYQSLNTIRKNNTPKVEHMTIPTYTSRPYNQQTKGTKAFWGRPFWFSLHYGALNLPDVLDDEDRRMIFNFITSLPIFLPCDTCKNHANHYINETPHDFAHIISSRENVFEFYWRFHNHVNASTGKRQITLEEAYDIYKNRPENAL